VNKWDQDFTNYSYIGDMIRKNSSNHLQDLLKFKNIDRFIKHPYFVSPYTGGG